MRVSIGIDIGKRKCDYCVVDSRGKVLERNQYINKPSIVDEVAKQLKAKYGKDIRAACETTGNMWNFTYDAFEKAGIVIFLANTYKMALIAKTGKKTDKIDAEKIANIVRMDFIPECYVPGKKIRGLRALVRQRISLVQDRTSYINRVHSLLDRHDLEIDSTSMYSKKALAQLFAAKLDPIEDEMALQRYARIIANLTAEIEDMDNQLADEAAQNEDAKLLASMTGIGPYISLLLAVEIADVKRFAKAKQMISWAGLCPVIEQSGDRTYSGKIKHKDVNKRVRWAMSEAANTAIRFDTRMKAIYETARRRHAGLHGPAIIVVANKMINIAWYLLRSRTPYESRNENLYKRKLARLERKRKK